MISFGKIYKVPLRGPLGPFNHHKFLATTQKDLEINMDSRNPNALH